MPKEMNRLTGKPTSETVVAEKLNGVTGNIDLSVDLKIAMQPNIEKKKIKITDDDIEDEVNYWKSALLCYVLGANPPLSVMDGFCRRMWREKVDTVGAPRYGLFLVRFHSVEDRDSVLNGGYLFFNNRPVVMKAWDAEMDISKHNIRSIPI